MTGQKMFEIRVVLLDEHRPEVEQTYVLTKPVYWGEDPETAISWVTGELRRSLIDAGYANPSYVTAVAR